MFEFLFNTGVPQDLIITFAFNVAGISEGNESFVHCNWLIRLMCGTHDDLDKSLHCTALVCMYVCVCVCVRARTRAPACCVSVSKSVSLCVDQ